MIQANELRIGNKLLFLGEIVTFKNITEIREDGIFWIKTFEPKIECKNFHFKPIPLSEEILLKCGFELNEDLGDMKYYQIPNEKRGFGVCFDHDEIVFYLFNIKGITNLIYDESFFQYLHQLQNLYFTLTGKELEINL